uniref:Uncharacterized protein n=1 Tax=Arundo donax TaxID=35708 RepID=A0A0A9D0X8_ARUDO
MEHPNHYIYTATMVLQYIISHPGLRYDQLFSFSVHFLYFILTYHWSIASYISGRGKGNGVELEPNRIAFESLKFRCGYCLCYGKKPPTDDENEVHVSAKIHGIFLLEKENTASSKNHFV